MLMKHDDELCWKLKNALEPKPMRETYVPIPSVIIDQYGVQHSFDAALEL